MSLLFLAVAGVLGLLAVGMYALMIVRNLIKLVIALQLLGKGAVLALVAAGSINGQMALGQSMAVTVIVADTIVAVLALALALQVKRRLGTLDVTVLSKLRG